MDIDIDKVIAHKIRLKLNKAKAQRFQGTMRYSCETCFHQVTNNCEIAENGLCCDYWFNPNSEIEGLAYSRNTKREELPLFA